MAHITSTIVPEYWSCIYNGATVHADILTVGGALGTPLILYHSSDANAYLGMVAGMGGDYNPIPAIGEWCEAGKIYGYNAGLVICRQSHYRMDYTPEETPALWIVYREGAEAVLDWIAGEQVYVGTHRLYDATEYVCLQEHVTQADWIPPATPALWQVYTPPPPPESEWTYPVAYAVGDIVWYGTPSDRYQCRQAHTSQAGWTPPAVPALWLKL